MYPEKTFEFTHEGRAFRASVWADDCQPNPWDNEDGHGPVRRVRSRDEKRPGEVILGDGPDRHTCGYAYDVQAAQRIALRDGWSFEGADPTTMTKRQIAAEAVREDIKRLEGWVRDEWFYVGVAVQALDAEGGPYDRSVWGIESDCRDYLREVAQELAGEVLADEARRVYAMPFDFEPFFNAYVNCALWSSTSMDEHGNPLCEAYWPGDVSVGTLANMRKDCEDFAASQAADLADYCAHMGSEQCSGEACAGHDFWLTRRGHGVGFWDRGLGELGARLREAAEAYGDAEIYVGDNGQIYA